MNARGIPSVQYTQTNQLEGLRRMQHARAIEASVGKTVVRPVTVNNMVILSASPVDVLRERIAADPCSVLGHRPAWFNSGGIACGVCGVYL